jgi:hypothetical protein
MTRYASSSALMLIAALVMAFVSTAAWAQGTDAFDGTWKLDTAKSTSNLGPGPKSMTVKFEGTDAARKIIVDVFGASGNAVHWELSGGIGTELPVVGTNPNADTCVLKRVNATTLEAQYSKDGKSTLKATIVVSADGKTLTITGTGTDAQGRTVNNVGVLNK